ncbi:MAG TPA: hypothetical protein VGU68_06030 [Ktedonobacteraceae bacterium]|nr:hypothetical protein [Ktedonobacteraceae bacterium]
MQVNDIKVVLRLAKVRAEQGTYSNEEYASNHASIDAVETWLREVGALPPERGSGPTHIVAATAKPYPHTTTRKQRKTA